MAVVQEEDKAPNVAAPPALAAQQAPIAAGGAGVAGATKPKDATSQTPGQNVPAQPSAQLSAYLAANQPQAQALGSQVAGQVGQQIQSAQNAIGQNAGTYAGNIYTVADNPALDTQVSQHPGDLTADQQAQFTAEAQAGNNVPNSANTYETTQGYQDTASAIQQAVEQADLWGAGNNPSALTTALRPFEAPTATKGDTTLDALLLSQNPAAYGQIQKAIAPAAGLQDQLASATTGADKALQNAIATDTATGQSANAAAQTYATSLTQYLQQQQAQAQAAQTAQAQANNALLSDANSGKMTAADAQVLGIPADKAQAWADAYNNVNPSLKTLAPLLEANNSQSSYYNQLPQLNLSQFLSAGTIGQGPTAANVASGQNYADVAALESMLGGSSPITLPIGATTSGQSGQGLKAGTSDSLNASGFGGAIQNALAELAAVGKLPGVLTNTNDANAQGKAARQQLATVEQYLKALA